MPILSIYLGEEEEKKSAGMCCYRSFQGYLSLIGGPHQPNLLPAIATVRRLLSSYGVAH